MSWSAALRSQIRARAEALAQLTPGAEYRSLGTPPTILFRQSVDGLTHGNFLSESWTAIAADPDWRNRTQKPHSRASALPSDLGFKPLELDSSNSSDALLMNCFCCPGAAQRAASVLGSSPDRAKPQFGFMARVALNDGTADATEVDMRLGDTLVEAKLTEANFTSRPKAHVFRYKAFAEVFDLDLLPGDSDHFSGYQLIRNVLAAVQLGCRLIVLIDQRRPDLLQEWWDVHGAINDGLLRQRCGVRTWQQVAASLAKAQRLQLEAKYGI